MIKTHWLPGGMVDAADSKSAVGNNVRVRVSGEPPLKSFKFYNLYATRYSKGFATGGGCVSIRDWQHIRMDVMRETTVLKGMSVMRIPGSRVSGEPPLK